MKIITRYLGFVGSCFVLSMLPFYGFAANGNLDNGNSWLNLIIYSVLLVMIVLAFFLIRGAKNLNESSHQSKKEGAEWIKHKLYDFNAEQLEILIKEVNKLENDNQSQPTEN